MKTTFFLLLSLIIGQAFAQSKASAKFESKAVVVEPIRIEKALDLSFGNVFNGLGSGSLTLTPDGIRTANGVEISENLPGTVTPAEAIVTHSNNSYAVSLPTSITLVNEDNPNEIIEVENFTLNTESNLVTGKDVLQIGATLHLSANQQAGLYSDLQGFRVTVSYN